MTTTPQASIDEQVRSLLGSMEPVACRVDGELRRSLVALERLINTAEAEQAVVMAEMSRRAAEADEIAVTLRCTKMVAASRYALALAVTEHPQVLAGRKAAISMPARCR